MAQYEPIGIKSGFPTNLGTDTLRADLSAVAGLTTAAPAAGDACQLSGALTITPAVNTSANPVVGIYDGVTGSVVRRGVVVASFVGGLTLVAGDAVYLSSVAGRLTNVKPTTDNLHEVGVVVSAAASTIMIQIKPVVVLPATTLMMDARSELLILPTKYEMPLPTTDAAAVALGWPSILGSVDGEIWLCDEAAGNLVGKVHGYQLAPQGGPLQNRDFQGLPYGGNLWAKKSVEIRGAVASDFEIANVATLDIGTNDFTISALIRLDSVYPTVVLVASTLLGHWHPVANVGFMLQFTAGNALRLIMSDISMGGWVATNYALPYDAYDGAFHLISVACDRNANTSLYYDGQPTDNQPSPARPLSINGVEYGINLGGETWLNQNIHGQVAWIWMNVGLAASRVGHDALWSALSSNHLGTANTYTRTNPLTYPIAASRVATAAPNMLPVGYNSNFVAGTDNTEKLGIPCEDGITFEPIGSDNMSIYADVLNSHSSIDGPSGMQDAIRSLQAAPWTDVGGSCTYCPACAIVGASNVVWYGGGLYKRATLGTKARAALLYTGDPGGQEGFNILTDDATPADWTRFSASATVTRAAQTNAYWFCGGSVGGENADFAEAYLIKNRSIAPLTWRRVGTAAAASTSTPSLSYTNVGNARYSPTKGKLLVRVSGFDNLTSLNSRILCFGAVTGPGNLLLTGSVAGTWFGNLGIWDDSSVQVVNLAFGAISSAQHEYEVEWDAYAGTAYVREGGVVLGSRIGAPWAPELADVTPLYVACQSGGGNAARCEIALLGIYNV